MARGTAQNTDRGTNNVFLGSASGNFTATAVRSTGIGAAALQSLTSGNDNTGIGNDAGQDYTTAVRNTVVGSLAHNDATDSADCTAIGYSALSGATTGSFNTAVGSGALINLGTGGSNIAIGYQAGGSYITTEASNILIGNNTGTVADAHVCRIGVTGSGTGQQTDTYLAGIVHLPQGQVVSVTSVTSTPYTVLTTDYVLACNLAGALAVNLFSSPATGSVIKVKDVSGAAAANNITITPAAGNIDGAASYVINTNYGSVTLVRTASEWSVL